MVQAVEIQNSLDGQFKQAVEFQSCLDGQFKFMQAVLVQSCFPVVFGGVYVVHEAMNLLAAEI